ncbi:M36 family metallopeptidase [Empedobacter sedimenti]|uniref:M36 family metallopeptidase n=1 Tax=Empedobacter sedimenti TaxID=3042610 RepID=UPI0024A758A8|nr:M36 family metallopeptidase [Empedobacter sedimenti]
MRKNYFLLLLLSLTTTSVFAQSPVKVVDDFLNQAQRKGTVNSQFDYTVVNENVVGNNVGDYVKIQQTINGIPVYGSNGTFYVKEGKVINHNESFVNSTTDNNLSVTPKLTVDQAVSKMAASLGKQFLEIDPNTITDKVKLSAKGIVTKDYVSYVKNSPSFLYYYNDKGTLKLAWFTLTEIKDQNTKEGEIPNNVFETLIDANTGELLFKNSIIHVCSFHPDGTKHNVYHNNPEDYKWIEEEFTKNNQVSATVADAPLNGTYRVIPATQQSPLKSDFKLLTNTYDPVASKEGWHKLVKDAAARNPTLTKYHTVGNNLQVGSDKNGVFSDIVFGVSQLIVAFGDNFVKNEVDGGEKLLFDFPNPGNSMSYDPLQYTDAAATQMFYSMNSIHDILYYHGVNPKAGSFQMNEGDKKRVIGFSTSGLGEFVKVKNNAIMAYSPLFARNPVTMFFTFETLKEGGGVLEIEEGPLKGIYKGALGNNTGFVYGKSPVVKGEFVLVNDGKGDVNDGCEVITNGEQLKGKVVLVNRGSCTFGDKVNHVKEFNPLGIIMLNNATGEFTGSFDISNPDLSIPVTGISKDIGDKIKSALENKETIKGVLPANNLNIKVRDSGFDSQVLLHEYTHAVSVRLTDGMIGGEEGMGEGWSDYVALNLTQQAFHTAKDQINMGEYAFDGAGLRELPYTTDMKVNPHTYDKLKEIGAGEGKMHPTGYVWALMLWEMHWKLIEKYGFNPDFKSNTGGNNMALDLVIEGLKIQKANPGFVDGRDGILMADVVLNGGENQCLIWEAFAKRGLGYSADQGDPMLRADGKEAFDLPPTCARLGTAEQEKSKLAIYPNPVKDLVYINAEDTVEKYEIIDVTGRVLESGTPRKDNKVSSISTERLSAGLYILKLHTTKEVVTKKIIKK